MKLRNAFTACMLLGTTVLAHAQTIKPGLWEITTQMQGGSGELSAAMAQAQKQMENMPPEQRKMMQDMMAKQGIQMGANGGTGMSIKMCMTQEMIDRNEVTSRQADHQQNDCTHTNSPRSGNSMKFSFVCTKPPSSGEGQVTFTSADAYSMKMSTTSMARGKPEKMDMQTSGRWLGSDCGTVKPFPLPKK